MEWIANRREQGRGPATVGRPYNNVPSYWGVQHAALRGPTTEDGLHNVTYCDGHAKTTNPGRLCALDFRAY